ncbi:MAG: FlgO family outer membrane protein [Limisphaerales bacterium]
MIGQTVSHYKILEKLGEGGMGAVYLAEDVSLGRKVAVKFLSADKAADPESRKRFIHEARAQALVTHTNVASFHEVGEEQDKVFIVMEYIEGQKLSELAKTEKLPLMEILDLAIQVGEGLQAAHERGVMHRDINPNNILVSAKRVAKITDFGLAKWKGASTITRTGLQMGTDHYMSPEQVDGRKVDFRTDIFSLGAVLYEFICARRPFEGANRESLFYEILYTQPQPLARYSHETSENLERIVSKCLAKKPEERYQSAADLVADLKIEKRRIETGERIPPRPIPAKKLLPFLVPVAIGLIAVVLFLFIPSKGEQDSLAVIDFENIPDPEDKDRTGEMITNLLITSLSQPRDLEVISRERLYDIQKELGKTEAKSITLSLASQIAERARVKTMLLGTLLQKEPQLAVTSRLIEVKSGKIISSQKVTGFASSQIFPMVDSLATLVRNDLEILPASASEARPVAQVTTNSPEAYRAYLEGIELDIRFQKAEAKAALERAIELDSNFATAYFRLAWVNRVRGDYALQRKALQKAWQLKSRVSEKERMQIEAEYARQIDKNPFKAAEIGEKLLQKYPREQGAYYWLAGTYFDLGDYEKAIRTHLTGLKNDSLDKVLWNELAVLYGCRKQRKEAFAAIDQYLKLAPAEPNPYDTKGDIYLLFGESDSARFWYQKAVSLRADFLSIEKLGFIAMLQQDYVSAEKCFRRFGATPDKTQQAWAEDDFALLLAHRGELKKARRQLLDNLLSHQTPELQGHLPEHYLLLTLLAYEAGDPSAMLAFAQKLSVAAKKDPQDKIYGRDMLAWACLKNGHPETAYQIMGELKKEITGKLPTWQAQYDYTNGLLAYEEGKYNLSLERFEKALDSLHKSHAPQ